MLVYTKFCSTQIPTNGFGALAHSTAAAATVAAAAAS